MNYFFSNFFRDRKVYVLLGLSVLIGLIIMDFLSFMVLGNSFFNLWVIYISAMAAVSGALAYGFFLHRRQKMLRLLDMRLPDFLADRRAFLVKKSRENHEFQTFCHECRHFNLDRLRCLLLLGGRKAWIKLSDDSPIKHCLYWNLEDAHPGMRLTEKVKIEKQGCGSHVEGTNNPNDTGIKDK